MKNKLHKNPGRSKNDTNLILYMQIRQKGWQTIVWKKGIFWKFSGFTGLNKTQGEELVLHW